jgi:hypothetical protein
LGVTRVTKVTRVPKMTKVEEYLLTPNFISL